MKNKKVLMIDILMEVLSVKVLLSGRWLWPMNNPGILQFYLPIAAHWPDKLFSDLAIEWFAPIILAFYGHRNRLLTLDPFWLPLFSQMDGFDTVNWPHILRDISIYYNVESLLGYLMVKILLLLYCDTWSYLMTKLYNR